MMHSTKLQAKISSSKGRATQLANGTAPPEQVVTQLYLAAYARRPTQEEMRIATEVFSSPNATRQTAIEDIMWALLNSAEFVLNH